MGHNYLSGDLGNDSITLTTGSGGFDTVLGGNDEDSITSATANDLIYGNQGNDTLIAGVGSSGDSLYGGQGNDVLNALTDTTGNVHHYLSGDLGNDVIVGAANGIDTIVGGQGSDTIVLGAGTGGHHDSLIYHMGDSTAQTVTTTVTSGGTTTTMTGASEINLDHVSGFTSGQDTIFLAGHSADTVDAVSAMNPFGTGNGNLLQVTDNPTTAPTTEAQAFNDAYAYAFGNDTTHGFHGHEYLAVNETYGGTTETYLFANDASHTAIAFDGGHTFANGDIVTGT